MSNRDIFIYPGEHVFLFLLSIFQTEPSQVPYEFAHAGVVVCSFFAWAVFFRLSFEIIKKLFGFNGGPRHG
ncbi:MAG: hypothetical protein MJK04_37095 [Psychrosphaera sp.]|nr:hypothetical protein [Psychrosphaera sp.]